MRLSLTVGWTDWLHGTYISYRWVLWVIRSVVSRKKYQQNRDKGDSKLCGKSFFKKVKVSKNVKRKKPRKDKAK